MIHDGEDVKVGYDPGLFTFDGVEPPEPGTALEFAGFRVLYGLERPEVLVPCALFAGARYFQAV